MAIDEQVNERLRRWENGRQDGRELCAEELCADCPELLGQVQAEIARLRGMNAFLQGGWPETRTAGVWVKGGTPLPGSRLIEDRPFNKGGSGEVWRAVTPGGFAHVLKRVPLGGDLAEREAEAMKLLPALAPHLHLLKVFDVQRVGEDLVISMEQADGSLLEELEAFPDGIPIEKLLVYARDAADGLDHLNCQNVRHRDIKPGNLLLFSGRVKVGDFGLAKAMDRSRGTHSGAMTPAYAAPEWRLGEVTPWSDQYSLAVTYAHLRTGKLPPELTRIPAAEVDVIRRGISEDPRKRWDSCLAFADALEAAVRAQSPPTVISYSSADGREHPFISYSSADGREFSSRLYDALRAKSPPIFPWLDKIDLKPGRDWDDQIVEAIRDCDAFLFVMSPDSVEPGSVCKAEWTRALRYKKPIVPLLLSRDIEVPFSLERRQHIDFTAAFEPALEQLCSHLKWLSSPAGLRQLMKDRLADAIRDLRRARDDAMRVRIQDEIALLEKQIADQERVVNDPHGVAARVQFNIAHGLEMERQPKSSAAVVAPSKFINPPPTVSPSYFQDRTLETLRVGALLKDESIRLIWVVGRGGVGKTALICRLLKSIERGELPDNGGRLQVDGIVYLSTIGSRRITLPNLFADICKLLPEEASGELESLCRDPNVATESKMQELLKHFAELRAVVLLDNFEDLVNPETRTIVDSDLAEALRVLLAAPHHRLKVVVTTRLAPFDLAQIQPGRQQRLDLDEGLPSPHAENILRALDIDGKVGLRDASDALLNEARERTRGFPKALECLFGILSGDRGTSLLDILEDTKKLLPDRVFAVLVGEAFSRLDSAAQQVLQAIAIYGRPVPPVAVDFLLQPYRPGMESAPILSRLVNMKLLHKETGRYYLHAVDTEYAMARIAPGKASDRQIAAQPPFTRFALFHRAANYFQQTRKPSADWKTLDDLAAQLAEFDMRCAGHEYETAVQLLDTIDFDYLQLWGHLRLIIELRERLFGELTDNSLARLNAGNLGRAYLPTGRVSEAIRCFEAALQGAREKADRQGISLWLGNLAFCRSDLGQTQKAFELCEEALAIAREIGDRKQEGSLLGFLGNCHVSLGGPRKAIPLLEQGLAIARETGDLRSQGPDLSGLAGCNFTLGQTVKAMEYVERALVIERKIGNRLGLGRALSMLAICYNDLDQSDVAVNYLQQALEIARQTGHHFSEGLSLLMLALIYVNEGRYAEALRHVLESIEISKKIERPKMVSFCDFSLAQVYFHSGDLAAARAAAESACRSNFRENTHNAFALLGLIALAQKDQAAARTAFERAVAGADAMLALNEFSVDAFDAKGLASCGLAMCGDPGKVPAAIEAYRTARAITRAAGLVKRVLRLFDALPIPDNSGVLAKVRLAAAGE